MNRYFARHRLERLLWGKVIAGLFLGLVAFGLIYTIGDMAENRLLMRGERSGILSAEGMLSYLPGNGSNFHHIVILLAFVAAFFVFSLFIIFQVRQKVDYIEQLSSELDILAAGDLSHMVTVDGEDEISDLADGIENMRRDLLARRDAEDKHKAANSELISSVSHDLRTPLTSLLGYLELIEHGKYRSEEELRHFAAQSISKTLQIKDMSETLLDYFLPDTDEWERADPAVYEADELLRELWGDCRASIEETGFSVGEDFPYIEGSMKAAPELLRRVFDNLYSNIGKYADPAKPVECAIKREGGKVTIYMKNKISPEREGRKGTRIGLLSCKRILEYHGGSLTYGDSEGDFELSLELPIESKISGA